ncbi:MAG TPA: GGDEF domain-containing protein [Gammaproteobacteria bacterium]|nr:GGDEF domain-containing protein [Gammaproteobacteria bacterium]
MSNLHDKQPVTTTLLRQCWIIPRIALIIAVVELVVMIIISWSPYEFPFFAEAVLDASLLVLFTTPLIFKFVAKPFLSQRDEAVMKLSHMAQHDPLTQLPNRRLLSEYLEKGLASSERHHTYGAIMVIDLDGFKTVNDTYGHDIGDRLLIEVAERLKAGVRAEDLVSRTGGDEFIIVLLQLSEDEHIARRFAEMVAEKIQENINVPFQIQNKDLNVGCSIGVRMIGGKRQGAQISIKEADLAMYLAKKSGGGSINFFS